MGAIKTLKNIGITAVVATYMILSGFTTPSYAAQETGQEQCEAPGINLEGRLKNVEGLGDYLQKYDLSDIRRKDLEGYLDLAKSQGINLSDINEKDVDYVLGLLNDNEKDISNIINNIDLLNLCPDVEDKFVEGAKTYNLCSNCEEETYASTETTEKPEENIDESKDVSKPKSGGKRLPSPKLFTGWGMLVQPGFEYALKRNRTNAYGLFGPTVDVQFLKNKVYIGLKGSVLMRNTSKGESVMFEPAVKLGVYLLSDNEDSFGVGIGTGLGFTEIEDDKYRSYHLVPSINGELIKKLNQAFVTFEWGTGYQIGRHKGFNFHAGVGLKVINKF